MKLNAPTQVFFLLALLLAILGVLGGFGVIAALAAYALWLVLAAYVVLAAGCLMKVA
jgi:hypothetical protein